jgi:cellulose synthase/poly-beta-1,6-N-acetylglucosamine synthase-like glycosyltransferase
MLMIRILQIVLGALTLLWAAYVIAMPLLARLRRVPPPAAAHVHPAVCVIVPAHDMEATIDGCIEAIRASDYPSEKMTIYVVADNCNDGTAARASHAGAAVLERRVSPAGKTYALAWTFDALKTAGIDSDLYIVTDATARVERSFVRALATAAQAGEDIVVGHSVVAIDAQKWFTRCLGLTLVHRNYQNWARERLRLSSLIEGRGMAYSRRYIGRHGWRLAVPTNPRAGQHPTEDWRHGVRVVEHGYRVAYADDAKVFTPLRGSLGDATRQGIRWERGRQLNALTHGFGLLWSALNKRNRVMLFAALDAIQLPVAILGVLCAAVAGLTWALPWGGVLLNALGFAPVVLLACYGILVTLRGRRDNIPASTIVWAPFYLLWRLTSFVLAWTGLGRR